MKILSTAQGHVTQVSVSKSQQCAKGDLLAVTELMKMLTEIRAPYSGIVEQIHVRTGDKVDKDQLLFEIGEMEAAIDRPPIHSASDSGAVVLAELDSRRFALSDDGRSTRIAQRHQQGGRSARENLADLLDEGSINELGAHALAAQRATHSIDQLIERSAADGVITATGTVKGTPVGVLIVDYTVMAGTQGHFHHKKVDRLLELIHRRKLPLILYPEGGGGRPNDVDAHHISVAQLELMTFQRLAAQRGHVPVIAVVHGYCFAGSAAFAAVADIIIGTETACLGMGGPAMIEGGGLGSFKPQEVGPISVHMENGVYDVICADEEAATGIAKNLLGLLKNDHTESRTDQSPQVDLNRLMPKDRRTVFDVHAVIDGIFDRDIFTELKQGYAPNMITGLARLGGRAVGVLANNNAHMGGAIDGKAADKASHLINLCQTHNLPLISLIDTPGFMVGPEAEATGQVRPIGGFFTAGAKFSPPLLSLVLRRAYGLGAMAMAGGSLHASDITLSWPSGEFGAMGLEGAVHLGMRDQLAAITDETKRKAEFNRLVDELYERGKALNAAAFFEFDDVIKPDETRQRLVTALKNISG